MIPSCSPLLGRLALAALAAAVFTVPEIAWAQRFGSRSNSLMSLAANDAVQKELGLASETIAQLNKINEDYRNASQKEFSALGIDYSAISDLPALERAAETRKASEKTADVGRKLTAVFLPKLADLLEPPQIQRLRQIQLQASGLEVWSEPEIASELNLSSEQQQKVAELRSEFRRRVDRLDGDFQQRFAKSRELNAERDRQALALLTQQQQSKLVELQGAPFDLSQLSFRRRQ